VRAPATGRDQIVQVSYAGSAAVHEGSRTAGEMTSFIARTTLTTARRVPGSATLLTAGFDAQWFEFRPSTGSLVPERLGSMAAKMGCGTTSTRGGPRERRSRPGPTVISTAPAARLERR